MPWTRSARVPSTQPSSVTRRTRAAGSTVSVSVRPCPRNALTVDPAARVRLVTDEGCVDGTLADLVQGMKVKVRGRIDRTTDPAAFIAVWIKAKMMPTPELSSAPPSPAP
jgi:hypothetical protein